MQKVQEVARRRFRRLYYIGVGVLVVFTIGAFVVPVYLEIRAELDTKIDQLSAGIMGQKRVLIETVVAEKIGDIERIRERLTAEVSPLGGSEFDRRFRAEVRQMIHSTQLPDDGYVWINEILDYSGGEEYAIRFAHPNLADTEGDFLSTNATDIHGNLPYLEELEGIRENGEIFFDYYFRKMHSDLVSHKLTYAKLYEPYDWIVATGVYLDDVDELVAAETERMIASTNETLRTGGIAVAIAVAILAVMTLFFETQIRGAVDTYIETERTIGSQLLEEKVKLEQSNQQKDRLLSIIAHDLRNPIHALSTGITMLDETSGDQLDDLGRTVVKELSVSALRVSSLLDHLLEWSHAQQDGVSFSPFIHDVHSIIEESCEPMIGPARLKEIAIHNRAERGACVFADEHMLKTVIRNLVSNAVKFTPVGGSVTIEADAHDEAVEISVTDTGVGIEVREQGGLFAASSARRTLGTAGEKGTGLGLNLCNEFVHRHGGHLRVASTPGEGSTFVVILPVPEEMRRRG